jgi:hypothetical protein
MSEEKNVLTKHTRQLLFHLIYLKPTKIKVIPIEKTPKIGEKDLMIDSVKKSVILNSMKIS